MSEDAKYHKVLGAQETANVSFCSDVEARQQDIELAERHTGMARSLDGSSVAISPVSADDSISTAIKLSRDLIQKSYHILAESR